MFSDPSRYGAMMRAIRLLFACFPVLAVAQTPPKWRLVEEWRKGGAVDGPYSFDGVLKQSWSSLAAETGGRVVWMDTENSRALIFDSTGAHVRTFGRDGAGPGEFRGPMGMAVAPGGNIVVYDQRNGRLVSFAPNGDFIRTITLVRRPPFAFNITWDGSFDQQGRLLQSVATPRKGAARSGEMSSDSTLSTERLAADFLRSDTMSMCAAPRPLREDADHYYNRTIQPRAVRLDGGASPVTGPVIVTEFIPFTETRNQFVRDRQGMEWSQSAFTAPELVRRESGRCGVVVARAKLRGARPSIATAVRDSAMEKLAADVKARVPREYPWVRALRIDDQNRLWVERDVATGRRFDVFASSGDAVAEIDVPAELLTDRPVLIANNRVIGFVKDSDDIPYLVSWKMIR